MRDAVRISRRFTAMVKDNYTCDKTIREKYDVVTASTEVNVASGYKQNVIGFGWTNAAYEKMQALVKGANLPEEKIDMPHRVCSAQ
jgi:alpha,alpha-trehalase